MKRRTWLRTGALTLAACSLRAAEGGSGGTVFTSMGMSGSKADAPGLKEAGASFLTLSTSAFLVPDKDEAAFEVQREAMADSALPVLACNGFLPGTMRCIGPDPTHEAILKWADTAFRRLAKAGGRFIVFGSSAARRLPDGFPRAEAEEQFSELLRNMGGLAAAHKVTVVVEQLRAAECNFINHIAQAAKLIRAANHPNVRILADLYHMRVMGDTPADFRDALDVVAHMEIAEKDERSYPGVKGDDFRPFFRVLHEAGWKGAISIEGRGDPSQWAAAFRTIREQSDFT